MNQSSVNPFKKAILAPSILGTMSAKEVGGRFFAKVDASAGIDGCWLWMGYHDRAGYGMVGVNGRTQLAHRVAWVLYDGDHLGNLCVLHKCDNRQCVNPAHLFVGTQQDNIADMVQKQRHTHGKRHIWSRNLNRARGEHNGRSKLTVADVLRIREEAAAGIPLNELGRRFCVSATTIKGIVVRETWRWVS